MKKIIFSMVLLLILTLSACGGLSKVDSARNGGSETAAALDTNYNNALPVPAQLVLGTFKLDETGYAIDAEMAADLLPLWKAARSLSSIETVAVEEMEAVFDQIQETMTPEQIESIASMQLTREDMVDVSREMGMGFGPWRGGSGGFENMTPEQQATVQAAMESGQGSQRGGFPGGSGFFGPGGGGSGGGGGSQFGGGGFPNLTPDERSTQIAERGGLRVGAGFNSALFDAVIEFLQGKTL